jgi:hypothetical protein
VLLSFGTGPSKSNRSGINSSAWSHTWRFHSLSNFRKEVTQTRFCSSFLDNTRLAQIERTRVLADHLLTISCVSVGIKRATPIIKFRVLQRLSNQREMMFKISPVGNDECCKQISSHPGRVPICSPQVMCRAQELV